VIPEVVVPKGGASGVVLSQGSTSGGWSLYVRNDRLAYCYNLPGVREFCVASDQP
jgi:hypothetical protein